MRWQMFQILQIFYSNPFFSNPIFRSNVILTWSKWINVLNLSKYVYLFFILNFRTFNVLLKEDPSSVYASDVKIETTEGPLDFDLSRVYTGVLEGKLI